jgi:hypothetical protein
MPDSSCLKRLVKKFLERVNRELSGPQLFRFRWLISDLGDSFCYGQWRIFASVRARGTGRRE